MTTNRTPGPWLVGGPYPGVSVCVCVDHGSGGPDALPPYYEAIAILDNRTQGEPDQTAQANAAFIVRACNAHGALVEALRKTLEIAESHIHSEYDGTTMLAPLLAKLRPAHSALVLAERKA